MLYALVFAAGGAFGAFLAALMVAAGTPEPSIYHPDAYEASPRDVPPKGGPRAQ